MAASLREILFFLLFSLTLSNSQQHACLLQSDCGANASCKLQIGLPLLYCVCNTGYTGDGLTCTLVDCGVPSLPAHSVWDSTSLTTYTSYWVFNCLPTYVPSGTSNITCQANGAWSNGGTCLTNSWNGTLKGDISGDYANGCRIRSIFTLGNGVYLMRCPRPYPYISYLSFYSESLFYYKTILSIAWYYGGVNYLSNGNVASIWVQQRNNTFQKGGITTMVPIPRIIKYSGDHEQCTFFPSILPMRDYQRCTGELQCYYRGDRPIPIGRTGQCWYPTCDVSKCNAGAKFMQKGYCHALSGGGYECVDYLAPGASCGGYLNGEALYPACNPFTSFCINGTCQLSSCLAGCEYGSICTLSGNTATCSGQGIPGLSDSIAQDLLTQVIPALPASRTITTQSKSGLRKNLMMLPRVRERSSRSFELAAPTPCGPMQPPCPANTWCMSGYCASPPSTPCDPIPC